MPNVIVKIESVNTNKMRVIDKDLQLMLKPLNVIQALFLCAKYKIRDSIIITNNVHRNLWSIASMLILTAFHFHSVYFNIKFKHPKQLSTFIQSLFLALGFVVGLKMVLNYYLTMKHRHENVMLLLKLQNVHRNIQIDGRKYTKANFAAVVALNCFYFFWMLLQCCAFKLYWWEYITIYSLLLLDINVLYAARILNLLRRHLEIWIKKVNGSGNDGDSESETFWVKMFNSFVDCFDAYQLLKKIFEVIVSTHNLQQTSKLRGFFSLV